MKKPKIYKYHTSVSYTDKKGVEHKRLSQLYEIGVYVIIDNNPALQFNTTPSTMMKSEKRIKKDIESGEVTNVVWGKEIQVHEVNGLWEEVKYEDTAV